LTRLAWKEIDMTAHPAPLFGDPPGPRVATDRMPGHWLLARLGKRVLRPGGLATTRWLLEHLRADDDVVELAPGMGLTAALILARGPRSYRALERDPSAARVVSEVIARDARPRTAAEVLVGDAARAPLGNETATFVIGEAMLSMQSAAAKDRIVGEAARLLAPGGRYAIHELALTGEDDGERAAEVQRDLSRSIHVGVRIHSRAGWVALLERHGFEVEACRMGRMRLLEPGRLVEDEGLGGAARIFGRALADPAARERVLAMRRVFRAHAADLAYVAIVARREPEWDIAEPRLDDRDGAHWLAGRCSSCWEPAAVRLGEGDDAPAAGRCVNGHRLRADGPRSSAARRRRGPPVLAGLARGGSVAPSSSDGGEGSK
jgi:SAM-dependent methyltransferase